MSSLKIGSLRVHVATLFNSMPRINRTQYINLRNNIACFPMTLKPILLDVIVKNRIISSMAYYLILIVSEDKH